MGFRFFAAETAQCEGVSGWVANREDGAVEVFVEGDRESVDRVEQRLRRGPSHARVDGVYAHDDVPSGGATGFKIRT